MERCADLRRYWRYGRIGKWMMVMVIVRMDDWSIGLNGDGSEGDEE
jgi:hypothetical protein